MTTNPKLQTGDKVSRRGNPGREGVIIRQIDRSGEAYFQVRFADGNPEFVPQYDLEKATEKDDWYTALEKGHFGNATDLRRHLSHVQISGKLASIIYSMDVTNTDFLPHQFKPVLTFLESPTRGLLIADEVGLGKTIEAGLIWTELRARHDFRRILVVCPAMLCEKWRFELRRRFGVDATIMKADALLHELKQPRNQVFDGRGIICSMQGIRPPRPSQRKKSSASKRAQLEDFITEQADNDPLIDLVVIDEAHYMRNRESQTAKLGKLLRDVSENILLLSATPINLRSADLLSLLNIVDQDTFQDTSPEFFNKILLANEPLIQARDLVSRDRTVQPEQILGHLREAAYRGEGFLDNSSQLQRLITTLEAEKSISVDADRIRIANKIEKVNLLRHVVNRTRKKEVNEWQVVRQATPHFVKMHVVEQKFYNAVTSAIRNYAKINGISDGFLLASPQQQVSSCLYAAASKWRDQAYQANPTLDEDQQDEDEANTNIAQHLSPLVGHLVSSVMPSVNLQQLRKVDSKFAKFFDLVQDYLNHNPSEKIIVFSYFRATLHYLQERLQEKNITSETLMGGMKENKQDVINRFRETKPIRILLSSEVASEGVDLQFCRALINYDFPWNPMKIEQRIGRIDRIGQKAKSIAILNLGHKDTIDQRIYDRLLTRLNIFKRALGGMEAVLGEKIKHLTNDLLSQDLTPEQEEQRLEDTATAMENTLQTEQELEQEASKFVAFSDLILNKVKTAHNLKKQITEDDLVIYVKDFLDQHAPAHEFRQIEKGKHHFFIKLPPKTAAQLAEFVAKQNLQGHSRLHFGERIRCEFINKTSRGLGGTERINQFHPLIRFISSETKSGDFFPLTAIRLPGKLAAESGLASLSGQYAFAVHKWKFTGLREDEDMRIRVVSLEQDTALDPEDSWKLLNTARLHGKNWPEAAKEVVSSAIVADKIIGCNEYLQNEFSQENDDKQHENTDRVNLQVRSAKNHHARQLQSSRQRLQTLRNKNDSKSRKMIPATEGRIQKIEDRFRVQIERLQMKANMKSESTQICYGILTID